MSLPALVQAVAAAQALTQLERYREQRAHLFPSISALQWWLRTNRKRAVEAGALLMVRGRWHVDPEKMDACVAQLGQEAARRQVEAA